MLARLAAVGMPTSTRIAATERDPIYAGIEAHRKARQATEAGLAEQRRLHALADAAVGPRRVMVPDMLSNPGVKPEDRPPVEVLCWIDLDRYVPAEINERYRKQRQKQWAAHSEFLGDLDHLVNEPADAEWLAAEELAETVPTTLPGLLAMLIYLGELDDPSAFMEDNGQTLFETLASGAKALVGRPA